MKTIKFWSALAVLAMVAGTAGTASACPGSGCGNRSDQVSTTAGFQIGTNGGVTALTVSSAVSDQFAFSSGVINTGGVYTEAFASRHDSSYYAIKAPQSVENGRNTNVATGETVRIRLPGDGGTIMVP